MGEHPANPPRTETLPRRANSGAMETIIGEDTTFIGGKLHSKGTLRIDGHVESEVQAEDAVVVGPSGTVKGNISARSIAISGKVLGQILARERLEIQPTGEVWGDVQTSAGSLIIEGGAKIEGKCVMGLAEKRPAHPVVPTPPVERPAPVERLAPIEAAPRPEMAQARRQPGNSAEH